MALLVPGPTASVRPSNEGSMTRRTVCLLLACWVLPALGWALPVSRVVDLEVGKEEFFRASLRSAFVDDPAVATVELLPSGEVLVAAHAPGRTLLYLADESRVEVVRLRVRETSERPAPVLATEAARTAAKKACPGLKEEGEAERTVAVVVSTPGCRTALRDLLGTDEYATHRLELNYSSDALQDQLSRLVKTLEAAKSPAVLKYSGVTLSLKGQLSNAQKQQLLRALYAESVGPVLIEDGTEVADAPAPKADRPEVAEPDAGLPEIKVEVLKKSPKPAKAR